MLTAKNISHSFNYPLFRKVNLQLNPTESIAIIGVSGSGKSTLLNILAGILQPKTGEVLHFHRDFESRSDLEKENFRRKDIGIIFQSHYLFKGFTTRENLEVASILSGQEIDLELLSSFGIDKLLNQKVTELSGGQQQRVSIARVLTKKPKIIFADEPTGNLDTKSASNVMDIIFQYLEDERAGMILVTHEEKLAFKCDKVFRLENEQFLEVEL